MISMSKEALNGYSLIDGVLAHKSEEDQSVGHKFSGFERLGESWFDFIERALHNGVLPTTQGKINRDNRQEKNDHEK